VGGRGRGEKSLEGAAASAAALGLAEPADGTLTPAGRRLALADAGERRELLRAAVLAYPPYRDLFGEIGRRREAVSTAEWIETWWAMRGMGNSASNRREGAATLGRLAQWLGLGAYIPGRRGHPTRIEWTLPGAPPIPPDAAECAPPLSSPAGDPPSAASAEMNRLAVRLADGTTVRLELPLRLPAAEKRRLLDLLDLLIVEE
jgi:hypothetical protein